MTLDEQACVRAAVKYGRALNHALRLAEHIPQGAVRVSESGIHEARDIARLRDAGFTAFLVGEHLMKSGDPAAALRRLAAA